MEKELLYDTMRRSLSDYEANGAEKTARDWMVDAIPRQVGRDITADEAGRIADQLKHGLDIFRARYEAKDARQSMVAAGVDAGELQTLDTGINALSKGIVQDFAEAKELARGEVVAQGIGQFASQGKAKLACVAALGAYAAAKNGVFGRTAAGVIDEHTAGAMGGAFAETAETAAGYFTGKINDEQATDNLKNVGWSLVGVAVHHGLKMGVNVLKTAAQVYMPTFSGWIEAGATVIKTTLLPNLAKGVTEAVKAVAGGIKSLWNSIFG